MREVMVLVDGQFERSLPVVGKDKILEKVTAFIKAWRMSHDLKDVHKTYSVKKVKGKTNLKEVWKFRINGGDRILFAYGKDLTFIDEMYQDSIILLEFCNHDRQIVRAKNKTDSINHEVLEELIERYTDQRAMRLDYKPEETITKVFKYLNIEELIHLERLNGIFYLNEEQRRSVNKDYRPLIVFGSAGSGKTTIGVYKLIDLIKQNPYIKVGYFTYSKQLAETAEQIYRTVLQNEIEEVHEESERAVSFFTIKDFLRNHTKEYTIVDYERFENTFYIPLYQQWMQSPKYKKVLVKFSAYDVWKEIRGLIKGFAGMNWNPCYEQGVKGIMPLKTYLDLGEQYSAYDLEERQVIYDITLRYMEWLVAHNLYDENDLCRELLKNQENLERYDWLVIDEVQDLTEVEIYLLSGLLRVKGQLLLSGDYHQTINPTYFDTRRLMSFLEVNDMRYADDENCIILQNNYRNPKQIVDMANHLSKKRISLFGKDKRNDRIEEFARNTEYGQVYMFEGTLKEQLKFLRLAVQKAYVYIVVATQKEKERLEELLNHKIRIFTVSEIKGLENKYIIAVNLLDSYKEKWLKIMHHLENDIALEESALYRYLFNMLYVTLTRSKSHICFMESHDLIRNFEMLFGQSFKYEAEFDELKFQLVDDSTLEDFFEEALKFEKAGDYKRAILQYEQIGLEKCKKRVMYCEAALLLEEGKYNLAAQHFEILEEYDEAMKCYERIKDKKGYYTCLLSYDKSRFIEEVILASVDYAKDVVPYLSNAQQKQVEQICEALYRDKLEKEIDDIKYQQLLVEELAKSCKETSKRLQVYERRK